MKKHMLLVLFTISCGGIETGNVGVRKSFFGQVSMEEENVGFYTALFDSVHEYSAKEIAVELENLTPKAKDNLSLKDMDVTVYYSVTSSAVAEMTVKYVGQSPYDDTSRTFFPCFTLVHNLARGVAYDEVAKVDSLKMHTQRDEIALAIENTLQNQLDTSDKGVFHVTRVVIRSVLTDPSIETAIQASIASQKALEAMNTKVQIAAKESEVRVAEARGVAEANHIINKSLTREYLQHEANQTLLKFAETGKNNTVVIPANMQVTPLLNVSHQSE